MAWRSPSGPTAPPCSPLLFPVSFENADVVKAYKIVTEHTSLSFVGTLQMILEDFPALVLIDLVAILLFTGRQRLIGGWGGESLKNKPTCKQ